MEWEQDFQDSSEIHLTRVNLRVSFLALGLETRVQQWSLAALYETVLNNNPNGRFSAAIDFRWQVKKVGLYRVIAAKLPGNCGFFQIEYLADRLQ